MFSIITEIVCMPSGTSTEINESQYIVSRLRLGSDPLFRSDRESRCDRLSVSWLRVLGFERPLGQCPTFRLEQLTYLFLFLSFSYF